MSAIAEEDLPINWIATTIGEVTELNPRLDKSRVADNVQVTFIPMAAVETENGRVDVSATRPFQEVKKGYTAFRSGDVLFAKITPCMENGKMAVVPRMPGDLGMGSTEFHVLRPHPDVDATYLYYYVSSRSFRAEAEHNMTGAVGQRRVPGSYLSAADLRLPPFAEQRRIVAKIEELFSELDAGVASLKAAREQLKVYRQSLLKHAFEGKLTAAWREENREKLETPETLLERIRTEREKRYRDQIAEWEDDVDAWEAKGKRGRKPRKPRKPKEVAPLTDEELRELPELPQGWGWVRLGEVLSEPLSNGRSVRSRSGGFPVLRLTAIQNSRIVLQESKEGDWTLEDARAYVVVKNDLLVSRGNGSIHLVGRGGIVADVTRLVAFPDTMIRVRADRQFISAQYLSILWESRIIRHQVESSARTTAGIYKINQNHIENFVLPVPSLEEQEQIVSEIQIRLSGIDDSDTSLANELLRAESLRQSILNRAFSGRLVPQDPSDEPASALLARIREERSALAKDASTRRKRRA